MPIAAVTEQNGQHYCFAVDGTAIKPSEVSIGVVTGEVVEILEGLQEGTLVALDARRRLSSGIGSEN